MFAYKCWNPRQQRSARFAANWLRYSMGYLDYGEGSSSFCIGAGKGAGGIRHRIDHGTSNEDDIKFEIAKAMTIPTIKSSLERPNCRRWV